MNKNLVISVDMTIQKILKESVAGDASVWVEGLKYRLLQGIEYPNVFWVNELISRLSKEQVDILKSKFKGITDVSQMHDRLAEVFAARKYLEEDPKFLLDNGNPDIYLMKRAEYVEVKRINPSDEEFAFEEEVSRNSRADLGATTGSSKILTSEEAQQRLQPLLNKTKELIDKGKNQLKGKEGFVHLFYSIDFTYRYGITQEFCEDFLLNFITKYSSEVKIRAVCEKNLLLHGNHLP